MAIRHYPPADEAPADRLRAATIAWAPLLGELHAVGFRPYLDCRPATAMIRCACIASSTTRLLLDVSRGDEDLLDTPSADDDRDWVVFVQADDGFSPR